MMMMKWMMKKKKREGITTSLSRNSKKTHPMQPCGILRTVPFRVAWRMETLSHFRLSNSNSAHMHISMFVRIDINEERRRANTPYSRRDWIDCFQTNDFPPTQNSLLPSQIIYLSVYFIHSLVRSQYCAGWIQTANSFPSPMRKAHCSQCRRFKIMYGGERGVF